MPCFFTPQTCRDQCKARGPKQMCYNDFSTKTERQNKFPSLGRSLTCYTVQIKAQFSKNFLVLKRDFNLSEDQLEKVFILPHIVCSEPYVKAFRYKVLNSILYTNTKLYKIGFISDNKCFFCKSEPETLIHLLFDCVSVFDTNACPLARGK